MSELTEQKKETKAEQVKKESEQTKTVSDGIEKAEIVLQYRGNEADLDHVVERVNAHYLKKGHGATPIDSIQIYIKPEDYTAYYVINDSIVGKINLF